MQEIYILVSGLVQGVGFRALVKRHALLYNIKGFVRNLPDGRVEICAQGNTDQIKNFIHAIRSKQGSSVISEIETAYKLSLGSHSSFEIR